MTDRQYLEELFKFMAGRNFVGGDPDSIRDMTKRYKQPPLTMHYRVGMQMTVAEYRAISLLLTRIMHHLKPVEVVEDAVDEPVAI